MSAEHNSEVTPKSSVVIDARIAADYRYVAQGHAHAVFEYVGRDTTGKFSPLSTSYLRLRKTSAATSTTMKNVDAAVWCPLPVTVSSSPITWMDLDAAVRLEFFKGIADAATRRAWSDDIEEHHSWNLVRVTTEALEIFESLMRSDEEFLREGRKDGRVVSFMEGYGRLSRVDAKASEGGRDTFVIELKPKSGISLTSRDGTVTSRFALHQRLKVAKGERDAESAYNPLDLFSGDVERIRKAVDALFACPQNNLRIFANSYVLFSEKTNAFASDTAGIRTLRMLQGILPEMIAGARDIFDFILLKQRLDVIGYSRAHALACEIATHTHVTPPADSIAALRDFIIAQIAKDCSVIFTAHFGGDTDADADANLRAARVRLDDGTTIQCAYTAQIIDISIKSLAKTSHWLALDRAVSVSLE